MKRALSADHSWGASARRYLELYRDARRGSRRPVMDRDRKALAAAR